MAYQSLDILFIDRLASRSPPFSPMDIMESDPVPTPKKGLRRRVIIQRVGRSPNGSTAVLEEHGYNFWPTPRGAMETQPAKKNRHRAKREAKQNAWDKFEPDKVKAKKEKKKAGALCHLRTRHPWS